MRGEVFALVGAMLAAVTLVPHGVQAGFNTNFTDPAGDTIDSGAPAQAMRDAVDVTGGTSVSDGTNMRITLTTVGTIGFPGATLRFTIWNHGTDALVGITLDGTTLECPVFECAYFYDYTNSGGDTGSGLIRPTVFGNTIAVNVPIAWGGDEGTYLLT